MKRTWLLPLLVLLLASLACSVNFDLGNPLAPTSTESPIPYSPTPTSSVLPPPVPELSLDSLLNADYDMNAFNGSPLMVTLVNGLYTSGPDTSAVGYISVRLGEEVAFGDLNYDGINDAAVVLYVNTGGTGVFTYISAVLNLGGTPYQAATVFIDDRPMIAGLVIVQGEIFAQTTIHSIEDPLCCPNMPVEQGWRLYNGNELVLTRWAGLTPGGTPRQINVVAPADLSVVAYPFTVTGSVTVGPFENTLGYAVYAPDNTLVTSGSVMTDSPNPGDPGNFSLPINLAMAGVTGLVRVEFIEYSMMDGSTMSLDAVLVQVP